jgi:hypothetical protein
MLSSKTYVPPIDMQGAASVVWTPEATEVLDRIPCSAQGLARTAVLRWGMERGHSIISQDLVTAALGDILPPEASSAIGIKRNAEAAVITETEVHICRECGYTARGVRPVACPVCGGAQEQFSKVDHESMLKAAEEEGEVSEELTFDNRKIGWSTEARNLLHEMPAGYLRRRIKAKVEKVARTRRLSVVTVQVAASLIEPELGRSANAQPHRTPLVGEPPEGGAAETEGFEDPSADAGEVDVALHTYAAGGVGGRYIPREASPTIARLRPREEGTTPGQGGRAADPATISEPATADLAAPGCPFHGDAEAQERIVASMLDGSGSATSDNSAEDGDPRLEPAKCPFHGDSEAQDQIVASLVQGPNPDS